MKVKNIQFEEPDKLTITLEETLDKTEQQKVEDFIKQSLVKLIRKKGEKG